MNIAYHELMNGSDADDRSEPATSTRSARSSSPGKQNGCVILGGGSPKNFYLQGQPTLWEVYGIPKGGQRLLHPDHDRPGRLGRPLRRDAAEAVSWGKVNPGVLPDTVVAYCDSTIAFPLFCEYAVGSANSRRPRKELVHKREAAGRRPAAAGAGGARPSQAHRAANPPKSIATDEAPIDTIASFSPDWGPIGRSIGHPGLRARTARVGRPAHLRRREHPERRRRTSCGPAFAGMCFFVLEHDDLRRARDIEHYRLARQLGADARHAGSRLRRRRDVSAGRRGRRDRVLFARRAPAVRCSRSPIATSFAQNARRPSARGPEAALPRRRLGMARRPCKDSPPAEQLPAPHRLKTL